MRGRPKTSERVTCNRLALRVGGASMISRSQRILGLDIGASTVKGVELARTGNNRFCVTGYAQQDISAAGTLKDAIAAVIREGRFKSKQVVSSVSGRSVIVRYITTPFMKGDELRAAMRLEADKYIPFDVNEVILDCAPLDDKPTPGAKEMRVVLVAVKKEVVNEHVRVLQEVGLFPYVIDVDCFALGNSFEMNSENGVPVLAAEIAKAAVEEADAGVEEGPAAGEAGPAGEAPEGMALPDLMGDDAAETQADASEPDTAVEAAADESPVGGVETLIPDLAEDAETQGASPAEGAKDGGAAAEEPAGPKVYALVDIGAQKTNINIMEGFNSYFTREVYIGGEDMTEAVAKFMGVSPVEAETVKRQGDQEASVLEAVTQTLDDLANEIFLSFDYFENQFDTQIKHVYLSGGGSRLRGITGALSQTLGREVQLWDPLAGFDVTLADATAAKLRENAPQLAVAIGLASRLRKV